MFVNKSKSSSWYMMMLTSLFLSLMFQFQIVWSSPCSEYNLIIKYKDNPSHIFFDGYFGVNTTTDMIVSIYNHTDLTTNLLSYQNKDPNAVIYANFNVSIPKKVTYSLAEDHNLQHGVTLPGGGILKILSSPTGYKEFLPPELTLGSSIDNMIIGFVLQEQKKNPDVILVSKDINVRLKCSSLGIVAQDYLSIKISDNVDSLFLVIINGYHLIIGLLSSELKIF